MLTKLTASVCHFSKIYTCPKTALSGIKDSSLLLVGGFGLSGIPMTLIHSLKDLGIKDITCVSNNCGYCDKQGKEVWGLAVLLKSKQIKRMIASYVGENAQFESQYIKGELQLQICSQGSLAEKIRSGGAGIPAFYTPTGVGTILEEGGFPIKFKQGTNEIQILSKPRATGIFNGKKYLMEQAIIGDYALVKAKKADRSGNLVFNKTARNFNADMCTAAKCVIAEVEEIVQVGEIDPDHVHVPGVFVDRIYQTDKNSPYSQKKMQKKISKSINKQQQQSNTSTKSKDMVTRLKIMRRAAKEVKSGMNVNLGIGIPTLLPSVLPADIKINLQSQNGVFGVGPYPTQGAEDPDLINAGKQTITILPGGSYFSSSQSFGIIRGGHLDLTMLGAMQVSETCDIANWIIPKKLVKGMGGAMDLVASGSRVIVVMEHSAQSSLKMMKKCSLPLTGKGVVSMVITELAVFENKDGKLVLTEIAAGTTLEKVQEKTGFKIKTAGEIKTF